MNGGSGPANGRVQADRTQEDCPARCKQTGRCYGQTYFRGKPGPYPGPECDTDNCQWMDTEKDERTNK